MRILRIILIILIGIVCLTSVNQVIFKTSALLSLGSVGVLFLAAVTILGLPIMQKQSIFFKPMPWVILCVSLQIVLATQTADAQTSVIPYTIVEISLLLLVCGLAYKISNRLLGLDKQAKLETATEIPTLDQIEIFVHKEITRSRHYERPLAIIAFRINPVQTDKLSSDLLQGFNQSTLQQSQQAQLIECIQSHMQRYHQLARDTKNDLLYLICPEANKASAEKIGQGISETISTQNNIVLQYAATSFPEDGFTFNKIHKEVLKRMSTTHQPVNINTRHVDSQRLSA